MTAPLWELAAVLLIFLASHSLPALPGVRARLVARFGERAFLSGYSLLSVAVLAWLIATALRAPYVELWPPQPDAGWVPVVVMPAACLLLVAGLTTPNPLSVTLVPAARSRAAYDPAHPGLLAITRHPVLWGFMLWAGAHLVPNGNLAAVTVFGAFLLFGFGGQHMIDARRRRQLGEEEWRRLSFPTARLPFAAVLAGRTGLDLAHQPWPAYAAGLLLYALLVPAHQLVIGVSAVPGLWLDLP